MAVDTLTVDHTQGDPLIRVGSTYRVIAAVGYGALVACFLATAIVLLNETGILFIQIDVAVLMALSVAGTWTWMYREESRKLSITSIEEARHLSLEAWEDSGWFSISRAFSAIIAAFFVALPIAMPVLEKVVHVKVKAYGAIALLAVSTGVIWGAFLGFDLQRLKRLDRVYDEWKARESNPPPSGSGSK